MKLLPLLAVLCTALASCGKTASSETEIHGNLDYVISYASKALLNGDTISADDGRLMVIQCRCDTAYLDNETIRPILLTGSSTALQWPDSSFAECDSLVRIARGGYHLGQMRANFNWDSIIALNPKQWIFQGGDNDISYHRPFASIKADAMWMIEKMITAIPDLQVEFLQAKPTGPNKDVIYTLNGVSYNGWTVTEWYNNDITRWGRAKYPNNFWSHNTYVPLLLWNPKRLNTNMFNSDQVHLNRVNGYRVWDGILGQRLMKH